VVHGQAKECLTSVQDIVLGSAGGIFHYTFESFIFHFFACRCRFVGHGCSGKRAG
jgi:hypothetical protein